MLDSDSKASNVQNLSEINTLEEDKSMDYSTESETLKVESAKMKLFCVFNAGGEYYGIPMDLVKEVVKMPNTTPIPQMPIYFSSMANVRGEVYGILDLAMFFQDSTDNEKNDYLLIVNDDNYRVGIALKAVPNTLKVEESSIEKLSSATLGLSKGKKYLSGIVKLDKQMIILFDIKEMIASDQFTLVTT